MNRSNIFNYKVNIQYLKTNQFRKDPSLRFIFRSKASRKPMKHVSHVNISQTMQPIPAVFQILP